MTRPPRISSSRMRLFKGLAILLPFILLALLEGGLRLFGYGHDLSLFVTDKEHPDHLVMNRYVSERYFTEAANATVGNAEPFRKEKKPGTMRIFVLGESTTVGFPYMHNGSFHRQLQYQLMQLYPEMHPEIINLSLTAVNSFTVRDMAGEIAGYEPDAVLIYCGHNEYYGALGVGSTSGAIGSWVMGLKRLRAVQLVMNTFLSHKVDTSQNLMERMAKEQRIPLGSVLYQRGIDAFKENIGTACRLLTRHHIPVFISTVVSNERGLPPFIGGDSAYAKGVAALEVGDPAAAKKYFVRAKEQDLLRFRAPEAINEEIKKIAGVYVVDSKQVFEAHSPHGIIDGTLLLEHVHPNLQGYYLLAQAFFEALVQQHVLPAAGGKIAERDMPLTEVDSLFGAYSILLLKNRWPFHEHAALPEPVTVEQALAYDMAVNHLSWKDAMEKLMDRSEIQRDTAGMLKIAEAVMLEYPLDPTFYSIAGKLAAALGQQEKANNYLGRAARL